MTILYIERVNMQGYKVDFIGKDVADNPSRHRISFAEWKSWLELHGNLTLPFYLNTETMEGKKMNIINFQVTILENTYYVTAEATHYCQLDTEIEIEIIETCLMDKDKIHMLPIELDQHYVSKGFDPPKTSIIELIQEAAHDTYNEQRE
jgi:hypothetical protein